MYYIYIYYRYKFNKVLFKHTHTIWFFTVVLSEVTATILGVNHHKRRFIPERYIEF